MEHYTQRKINPTNENNIKSLRINICTIHNQTSIANELNEYFLKIAGNTCSKRTMEKMKWQLHYKTYLNTLISLFKTYDGFIRPQKK